MKSEVFALILETRPKIGLNFFLPNIKIRVACLNSRALEQDEVRHLQTHHTTMPRIKPKLQTHIFSNFEFKNKLWPYGSEHPVKGPEARGWIQYRDRNFKVLQKFAPVAQKYLMNNCENRLHHSLITVTRDASNIIHFHTPAVHLTY